MDRTAMTMMMLVPIVGMPPTYTTELIDSINVTYFNNTISSSITDEDMCSDNKVETPRVRVYRAINTHSLAILLLATCVLVVMLVIDSHHLQTPRDVRNRMLQDMFGVDSLAISRWWHRNQTKHEPEFVLR